MMSHEVQSKLMIVNQTISSFVTSKRSDIISGIKECAPCLSAWFAAQVGTGGWTSCVTAMVSTSL